MGAGGLGSIGEGRGALERLMEGDLDLRPAARSEQPRRDHAGVVEHQQVARAKQRRQIAHTAILERLRSDHQQAGGISRPHRILRDQLRREDEIEQIDAHGGASLA